MGLKRRGFGMGKLTGIGGKIEAGETPAVAAAREVAEEVAITLQPGRLRWCADLDFRFPLRPAWSMPVRVFVAELPTGAQARASDEIDPCWLAVQALPFERMWDDGRYWLPGALRERGARWRFQFAADNATVQLASRVTAGAARR